MNTIDTDTFIDAGHATTMPSRFVEPVTISGWYVARNGFSYHVAWNNGHMTVGTTGYSAAYRAAARDYERVAFNADEFLDEEARYRQEQAYIAQQLGIG